MTDSKYWERRLAREGMPSQLKQIKPIPRVDRDWADHFAGANPRSDAHRDAVERMRLDMETAQGLFSMLADIRWGRHDQTIEALTAEEHEVFDPYCDGLPLNDIAQSLGISRNTVRLRFLNIMERFTAVKPRMRRNHP